MKTLISVSEALSILEKEVMPCKTVVRCPLDRLIGKVLAEDLYSTQDVPGFDQSAMDGYAVCGAVQTRFDLVGEVQAGALEEVTLREGQAVRIFTGAMVPDTATGVIQQELTKVEENELIVESAVPQGKNIRPRGEQFREGERALEKGTIIRPGGIGFLASLGFSEVSVFKEPTISLLTTGDELVAPGRPIKKGQVYESNGIMLHSALEVSGFSANKNALIADSYELTRQALDEHISGSDVVIITGGISVGDYDFVGKALVDLGVTPLFYKVKQKPGKPLFVGKKGEKLIFALPGNPAAALTCFYMYVLPSLNKRLGKGFRELKKKTAQLNEAFQKKSGRAVFLKGNTNEDGQVAISKMQSSAMLGSFAVADVLIYIPEEVERVEKGEKVKIYELP